MSQTTYIVNGMTCEHCVKTVQSKLSAVSGVSEAKVQLLPPRATVTAQDVGLEALSQSLEDTKFTIQSLS